MPWLRSISTAVVGTAATVGSGTDAAAGVGVPVVAGAGEDAGVGARPSRDTTLDGRAAVALGAAFDSTAALGAATVGTGDAEAVFTLDSGCWAAGCELVGRETGAGSAGVLTGWFATVGGDLRATAGLELIGAVVGRLLTGPGCDLGFEASSLPTTTVGGALGEGAAAPDSRSRFSRISSSIVFIRRSGTAAAGAKVGTDVFEKGAVAGVVARVGVDIVIAGLGAAAATAARNAGLGWGAWDGVVSRPGD